MQQYSHVPSQQIFQFVFQFRRLKRKLQEKEQLKCFFACRVRFSSQQCDFIFVQWKGEFHFKIRKLFLYFFLWEKCLYVSKEERDLFWLAVCLFHFVAKLACFLLTKKKQTFLLYLLRIIIIYTLNNFLDKIVISCFYYAKNKLLVCNLQSHLVYLVLYSFTFSIQNEAMYFAFFKIYDQDIVWIKVILRHTLLLRYKSLDFSACLSIMHPWKAFALKSFTYTE